MDRAEVLRIRRRRRRTILTIAFSLVLGILVSAGVGLGAAVGAAATQLRGSELLTRFVRSEAPSLPAHKVNPPPPVDISGPAVACAASALTLTVQPDRVSLEPGEGTGIHVTVTHSGRYPCLVNGGMENLRLRMVDALGETGWSAADCGFGGTRALLMGPGNQVTWDIAWDGRSSVPGNCSVAPLPSGTWQLIGSLAEVAHSDSAPVALIVRGTPIVEPSPEPEPEPENAESEIAEPEAVGPESLDDGSSIVPEDDLDVPLEDAAFG